MAAKARACGCLLFFGFLFGCQPAPASPLDGVVAAEATRYATATDVFTPTLGKPTETSTPTPTFSPTASATPTISPTPWPAGFTPTVRSTPTPGLAPPATPAAAAACPEPSHGDGTINHPDDPAEYEPQLLAWLSAEGNLTAFQKAAEAADDPKVAVFQADVNADSVAEFVVGIRRPFEAPDALYSGEGVPHRTAVFILGCAENRYAVLYRLILDGKETDLHSGILAVDDLNRNGVREIVISVVESVNAGGIQNLFARILEWDGSAFRDVLIPEPPSFPSSRAVNAPVEMRDIDGNGTQDLLVPDRTWPDDGGVVCEADGGPARNSESVWMWDGEYYRYMWRLYSDPQYRFQAAYDGDYYAYIGMFDRAEISYLRAVFDESLPSGSRGDWMRDGGCKSEAAVKPDSSEPPSVKAYARFRLVELLVRIGRVREAESHRTYLRNAYPLGSPGYLYAHLANIFWWGYMQEEDISAACVRVRQEAEKHAADVFNPFTTYGSLNPGPTIGNICPFPASSGE
jgi:hypothetical protein